MVCGGVPCTAWCVEGAQHTQRVYKTTLLAFESHLDIVCCCYAQWEVQQDVADTGEAMGRAQVAATRAHVRMSQGDDTGKLRAYNRSVPAQAPHQGSYQPHCLWGGGTTG